MVKKLFKHEIISYLRTLMPVNIILLAVAIMGRIIQFFENNSLVYGLIFGSTVFALGVAIVACMFMTFIIAIVRFYKNLFTAEGYLSFTLPVTPAQHIWVKLATAILFQIIAVFTIVLSFMIFVSGEFLVELFKAFGYLLSLGWTYGKGHMILFMIEIALCLLVGTAYEYLLWYACISIGQRSRKNRIFMAILTYFGYYMITQVISTVITVFIAILGDLGIFESLGAWIEGHPMAFMHTSFCLSIVITALIALLWFFISRNTMKNRLNLE